MPVIESLAELSLAELHRVRRTLADRFRISPQGEILEVGFGMAEKGDRLDRSRPDAFCFWVAKKRKRPGEFAIPAIVSVRLRRGNRFVEVRLPSDVLQPSAAPRATGRNLYLADRPTRPATAGGIIAWRVASEAASLTWAVLTVGHLFSDRHREAVRSAASHPIQVQIDAVNRVIVGDLTASTQRHDGSQVDAAIVTVRRRDLVDAGLMPENVSTRGKRVRTTDQLWRDQHRVGLSLVDPQPLPIEIGRFYPLSSLVAELGTLANVFEALSAIPQTFAPGRSGTLWAIAGHAAGMQHAGYPLAFMRGLAQGLSTVLEWAAAAIAQRGNVPRQQVDLRLIRAL